MGPQVNWYWDFDSRVLIRTVLYTAILSTIYISPATKWLLVHQCNRFTGTVVNRDIDSCYYYVYPEDVDALYKHLLQRGGKNSALKTTYYRKKEFDVQNPGCHMLSFGQDAESGYARPFCGQPRQIGKTTGE